MKLFVVLCLSLAIASAHLSDVDYRFLFGKFVQEHNKIYTPEEYFRRFQIFQDNVDFIVAQNEMNHTYTLGIGPFADLTFEEFTAQYLSPLEVHEYHPVPLAAFVTAPKEKDWQEEGMVPDIKDQGQCGSCWAFSAVSAIETACAIHEGYKPGELVLLSEQELVDCSKSYGNHGCQGGLMDNAFKYVIKNGLCKEDDYQYTARDGACKSSSCTHTCKISSFVDVVKYSEEELIAAEALTVVSVAIAVAPDFQHYKEGIFDGKCAAQLNHGVALVGYGEVDSTLFWRVRNSWGTRWGEQGYIRMKRGPETGYSGKCGILSMSSYPKF